MSIAPSEWIRNADGSIYHLHLQAEQVAPFIFTVGDLERVEQVSKHFDRIEHRVQKREFITHTGYIGNRRMTVISTGIGTDNIDIVINELDALFNLDPLTGQPKPEHTSLSFVRLGTSGAVAPDLEPGSFLVSRYALGLDNLLHFYQTEKTEGDELARACTRFFERAGKPLPVTPYSAAAHMPWADDLERRGWAQGITLTAPGFYGPQMRTLRLPSRLLECGLWNFIDEFTFNGYRLTNFEMETSALYAMAKALGHKALSLSTLVAQRRRQLFSPDPLQNVEDLIVAALEMVNG